MRFLLKVESYEKQNGVTVLMIASMYDCMEIEEDIVGIAV